MVWMNVAMQKNRPLIQYSVIFSLVCLLGIAPVSQARMYKWVDADGNTHYTQSPPPDGTTKEDLNLPASANLDNTEALKEFEDQQNKNQELAEENEKEQKLQDRSAEHTALKKENCRKAKAKLENVQNTGRIRAVDEYGNIVRATEEERQRRITEAQENIKKWCV